MHTQNRVQETLDQISKLAATVAKEADRADKARDRMEEAQSELLKRAIEVTRPALRAIGTRPEISVKTKHHADVNYGGGVDEIERYPERCLCLNSAKPGPTEDTPRANSGSYYGRDLFLSEDGGLFELAYSGTWSCWQGASFGWEAEVKHYASELEAVQDGWSFVDDYLAAIACALEKAAGSREKSTAKTKARAEQIAAVVALLKGGRS